MRYLSTLLLICLILALPYGEAKSQSYPNRPVDILVGFPAGGTADNLARLVQKQMGEYLGQPIIVKNKPGAGTNIATISVARAKPDGYELLLAVNSSLVINPHIYKHAGLNVLDDLTPVALLTSSPIVIVARTDAPFNNLAELFSVAKQRKGAILYGTPGIGTPMHLLGEMLQQRSNISMTHVPYKGSPGALSDLLGGSAGLDLVISTFSAVTPFLNSGAAKVIAIADPERSSLLPSVATVSEALPGLSIQTWYALVAPARTPPVVDKLYNAAMFAMNSRDVQNGLAVNGMVATPGDHARVAAMIHKEYEEFGKIVAERKIPIN